MKSYKEKSYLNISLDMKAFIIRTVIAVLFLTYLYHLFSLQIKDSSRYQTLSKTNSASVTEIAAQRGEIFDRYATLPIVINTDSFSVEVTPGSIPKGKYDTVASKLASMLGISKKSIDNIISDDLRNYNSPIPVKTNVSFNTISNIAENISDLPGVSWVSKPIRNYVETGSIAHVVGYVGNISKTERNVLYNQGYVKANEIIGKTGIESQYDSLLKGESGEERRTVDVRGRIISETPEIKPPTPGKNVVLTIDSSIQTLAEKTLGKRVGAVVVLKPATGEILAMASYPFFDPNRFNDEDAGNYYASLISEQMNRPLVNRAVNAEYPPASTFKVIMSTAMLQEKAFPSKKQIECKGYMNYGNRKFRCHLHSGHGWVDMKNGLAESCDVYYWTVGRDYLGIDKIHYWAEQFGFGQSAQIDLPSQRKGFVPTAEKKERQYHEKWLGGDTMSTSIGQGYLLVTPLQVANMAAMVANRGVIYKPHLLKEVRDPITNEVLQEVKPEVLFKTEVNDEVWTEVQNAMRYTITDGTPRFAMMNKNVQIAGKTGTAEVAPYKDSWHSWLVAYAPFDAPVEDQVVVSMIVEACNPWEWWSPYGTNIIMQGIFGKQTYEEAAKALGLTYLARNGNRRE